MQDNDNYGIKGIKFSEETKEFSTGAHRGGGNKYPFEYLPMVEAGKIFAAVKSLPDYTEESGYAKIFEDIEAFKSTGNPDFITEAAAIFGKLNFVNTYECLGQTSVHFKRGAEKYGLNNWQKGMPLMDYVGSLSRHLIKVMDKWDDEPHQSAFMWNAMTILWTISNLPEMNNLPANQNKQ